ncbi:MAG: SDR family oxidoreductase [Gammaproteobacteria bacterium]|nr:SDR family oxidoreductase [Gammaproteobacteria bacterium]
MVTQKKTVLITGCSSGIGLCVAEGLMTRGYRVFATARKEEDVEILEDRGLESLQLDLDSSESIRVAVTEILARSNNQLYGLFNNGAYGQPGAIEDLSRRAIRAQFETNLFGTMELTNAILPTMRKQGYGRIIQNSSLLGFVALPYRGAYNASKYALEGLTDTLRLELAGTDIHISLIEPGPIKSRFRANAFKKYQEHINVKHSVHKDIYLAMDKRLSNNTNTAPFTLPPSAVLNKVVHALESPLPRIRYYVTFPTYLFGTLKTILPTRALDWILKMVAHKENS